MIIQFKILFPYLSVNKHFWLIKKSKHEVSNTVYIGKLLSTL